jgi:PAS domain S-box-containing protein
MDYETMSREQLLEEINRLNRQRNEWLDHSCLQMAAEAGIETGEANGWQAVFNTISHAIWVLDDQCRIKRANKASERIFGKPMDEIVGRLCWEIALGTSSPVANCPAIRAMRTRKQESLELQKGEQWYEIVVDVISGPSGEMLGYVHVVSDITERKRAQLAVAESEEKYRIVSDFAHDWEYWLSPEGMFLHVSPSCERVTGYSPADFMQEPGLLQSILHSEDRAAFSKHLAQCSQCTETHAHEQEFRILARNGAIVWLEHRCRPVYSKDGAYRGRRACNRDITDRKQAEEALQIREQWLRAIVEASTESILLMNEEGDILIANTTTAKRLNITMESLAKTNIYSLLPAEVVARRRRYVRQVIETAAPVRFEDERFGRIILNSIYPVQRREDGKVSQLAIFGMDVTAERQSRQLVEHGRRKLAEANAMLQLVLDTIPVRIFWKDTHSVYLGCNRLFALDAGRQDPADLLGDNDSNMGWKEQADQYVQDDRSVMASGLAKLNYEERQTTPEGESLWLRTSKVPLRDHDNRIIGLLGIYEDITERKMMEEQLRESEERYRSIFQNNHAVLLLVDPEEGWIVHANPAACAYYGYDLETLQGKKITEINTLTPEEVFEEMARAKAEQRDHFFFSHRLASGDIRPVEVYSGPVVLGGRRLLYSIVHDISERKRAEEERERLILELRDALVKIKTLSGMLPICASCKKIRNDQGYWQQIESYIREHSQATFTHGVCPECAEKLYPEFMKGRREGQ